MARILIVDDEEMDRVLESEILRAAGYDLSFAEDGEAALELCERNNVDLVITDLAMPKSSGLRFIRELREAGLTMPVIAVSGWAKDQLDLAERYGADFILGKPLDGDALLDAVDKALRSVKGIDPWRRVR